MILGLFLQKRATSLQGFVGSPIRNGFKSEQWLAQGSQRGILFTYPRSNPFFIPDLALLASEWERDPLERPIMHVYMMSLSCFSTSWVCTCASRLRALEMALRPTKSLSCVYFSSCQAQRQEVNVYTSVLILATRRASRPTFVRAYMVAPSCCDWFSRLCALTCRDSRCGE